MSLRDVRLRRVAKDAEGTEDTGAAASATAKGVGRAGSGIQIPPPLNWITRRAAVRNMNMAMICGLVNPFITNNNVTARGGRPPVRRREARWRRWCTRQGPVVGRGASGACSRLEIHLQYRPRLFSCLITPCRLKLNNKIYASQRCR